jgi:glycosyltransferase involved in cell wall biosynthesis
MAAPSRPLHIGIYLDYGITYLPDEGIGVFVYNLIRGLLTLQPRPRITLQVHPGDECLVHDLIRDWAHGVTINPPPALSGNFLRRFVTGERGRRFLADVEQAFFRIHQARERVQLGSVRAIKDWARARAQAQLRAVKDPQAPKAVRLLRAAVLAVLAVPLIPLLWAGGVAYQLLIGWLVPGITYPAYLLLGALRFLGAPNGVSAEREALGGAVELPAGCDVWLLPHGRTRVRVPGPEVLILWDLAHHYVTGLFSRDLYEVTDRQFAERARTAAVVFCASRFVLEHDLHRLFPFAIPRMRIFPLAPPLPPDTVPSDLASLRRRYGFGPRYVFYPAALRLHKNHGTLMRAMGRLLRDGDTSLELVCTGKGDVPPRLARVIEEEGLKGRVHFLGVVPRADIAALYCHSALTVNPSVHEGYGLPVLEALQSGSLLTCSDIPAFRELLEGHHDALRFFDPRDPDSLADAMRDTLRDHEELGRRQREAYAAISRRDWSTVAADFLRLFEEACGTAKAA